MCATMTGRLWRPERSEKLQGNGTPVFLQPERRRLVGQEPFCSPRDMHTRPEGLTNLMAKAEMELRRTTAQRRATTYMFVASIAAAAITAGIAAYVAFHGG